MFNSLLQNRIIIPSMVLSLQATKKQKLGLICSLQTAGVPRLSFPLRDRGSRLVGSLSYISTNPPGSGIRQMSQLWILWAVLGLCSELRLFYDTHKNAAFLSKSLFCLFGCSIGESHVPNSLPANDTFSCRLTLNAEQKPQKHIAGDDDWCKV